MVIPLYILILHPYLAPKVRRLTGEKLTRNICFTSVPSHTLHPVFVLEHMAAVTSVFEVNVKRKKEDKCDFWHPLVLCVNGSFLL